MDDTPQFLVCIYIVYIFPSNFQTKMHIMNLQLYRDQCYMESHKF